MRVCLGRCFCAMLLALAGCAHADDIDEYVRTTMAREKIPGVALAVLGHLRPAQLRTYGFANLEHHVDVKPATLFQSGSVGKQFTATAVMLLVMDGKLGFDDPLSRHFAGAPETWRRITVRHLLTHTSGLPDYEAGGSRLDLRRDYTEEELAQLAMRLELAFEPGTRWAYSNTGYIVLGLLVGRISGRFYGEFLQQRVFGPLGMKTARVISEADIVPNRAAGHELVDGTVRNQRWVSPSLNRTADGSLYLGLYDYAAWDSALWSERLLPRQALEVMWTPVRLADGHSYPYGFGWFVGEQRGWRNIEHPGAWQGFKTHIARYVDRGISIVVLCNLDACAPTRMAHEIAGLVDPVLRLPDPRTAGMDPHRSQTSSLHEVLKSWARGEPSEEMAAWFRTNADRSPRSRAMREEAARRLDASVTFRYLAEDDVRGKGLERGAEPVARIVYCAVVTAAGAHAYRFYLNERGEVLHVVPEDW